MYPVVENRDRGWMDSRDNSLSNSRSYLFVADMGDQVMIV